MPLPQTRGPLRGRCNICGEEKKLTSDHVPPKGVNRFTRMELHSVSGALNALEGKKKKFRQFQNGVKFRSLCRDCNGGLLGKKYDPALGKR